MRTRPKLYLRTNQTTTMGGNGYGDKYGRNDRYNDGGDRGKGDPKDPILFPDYYRRIEPDQFQVFIKYDKPNKRVIWWSYRASSREKESKSRQRGGVVQAWGEFRPHCDNIEDDLPCLISDKE